MSLNIRKNMNYFLSLVSTTKQFNKKMPDHELINGITDKSLAATLLEMYGDVASQSEILGLVTPEMLKIIKCISLNILNSRENQVGGTPTFSPVNPGDEDKKDDAELSTMSEMTGYQYREPSPQARQYYIVKSLIGLAWLVFNITLLCAGIKKHKTL